MKIGKKIGCMLLKKTRVIFNNTNAILCLTFGPGSKIFGRYIILGVNLLYFILGEGCMEFNNRGCSLMMSCIEGGRGVSEKSDF